MCAFLVATPHFLLLNDIFYLSPSVQQFVLDDCHEAQLQCGIDAGVFVPLGGGKHCVALLFCHLGVYSMS
jgi:hypothetical protein